MRVIKRKWSTYRLKRRKHFICMLVSICSVILLFGSLQILGILSCTMETDPKSFPLEGVGVTIKLTDDFYPSGLNSLCDVSNLTAVIPVNSAAGSFNKRNVLRESLRHVCRVHACRTFFIVGASSNISVMAKLSQEVKTHEDILVVDKEDTYKHISNKLVAMLQWLNMYCTSPKYVIFLNDDTYVNFNIILSELEASGGSDCNCIVGDNVNYGHVKRDTTSPWYISKREYPCWFYPRYCKGPAYGFPNAVTSKLLSGVHEAPYVWPDDIWLTGIVREHVGVRLVSRKSDVWMQDDDSVLDVKYFHKYFYVHNVTLDQMSVAYKLKQINKESPDNERLMWIELVFIITAILVIVLVVCIFSV